MNRSHLLFCFSDRFFDFCCRAVCVSVCLCVYVIEVMRKLYIIWFIHRVLDPLNLFNTCYWFNFVLMQDEQFLRFSTANNLWANPNKILVQLELDQAKKNDSTSIPTYLDNDLKQVITGEQQRNWRCATIQNRIAYCLHRVICHWCVPSSAYFFLPSKGTNYLIFLLYVVHITVGQFVSSWIESCNGKCDSLISLNRMMDTMYSCRAYINRETFTITCSTFPNSIEFFAAT